MLQHNIEFKSTILIILLSVVVLFSCSEVIPVINRFENQDEIPTITATNVEMSYTEKGYLRGVLTAKVFQTFDREEQAHTNFPEGIKIVLYNKDHHVETDMIADSAIYYQDKRNWEAMGNVVIKNVNGTILETEKLYGDEKEKKIFTDQFVKITKTDGTTIIGKNGFVSNTEFTIYKFMDVRGKIFFNEELEDINNQETSNQQDSNTLINAKQPPKLLPENIEKPDKIR